jgi:hypothetical protein
MTVIQICLDDEHNRCRRRSALQGMIHTNGSYFAAPQYYSSVSLSPPSARGSSVSIVSRLRAGGSGFDSRQGLRIFFFATAYGPLLGPAI